MSQKHLVHVDGGNLHGDAKLEKWATNSSDPVDYIATGMALDPTNMSATTASAGQPYVYSTVRAAPWTNSPANTNAASAGVWVDVDPLGTGDACRLPYPGTWTGVGAANKSPQEVVAVRENGKTRLYVAWGEGGVWATTITPSQTVGACPTADGWIVIADPAATTRPWGSNDCTSFSSIDAFRKSADVAPTTLWFGCEASSSASAPNSVFRLHEGASPADTGIGAGSAAGSVSVLLLGAPTQTWWHVASPAPNGFSASNEKLGGKYFISSQIAIDPSGDNPDEPTAVITAGKGGMWRTSNADATTAGTLAFAPAMKGFGATINQDVEVDPGSNGKKVAVGDVDWGVLLSNDGLNGPPADQDPGRDVNPNPTFPLQGRYVKFRRNTTSPTSTQEELHGWGQGSSNDYVAKNPSPYGTSMGWHTYMPPPTLRPSASKAANPVLLGMAIAANRTIFVKSQVGQPLNPSEPGIVYRSGSTWVTSVLSPTSAEIGHSGQRVQIAWRKNTPYGWLNDQLRGVFRTSDGGVNWTQISPGGFEGAPNSGFLAYDPGATPASDRLIYSSINKNDGTYVLRAITSPRTCVTPCAAVDISPPAAPNPALTTPGPMTVDDDGYLWITQPARSRSNNGTIKSTVEMYRETSAGSDVLENVTDTTFQHGALNVTAIAAGKGCDSDQPTKMCVYAATFGNGTYVVRAP